MTVPPMPEVAYPDSTSFVHDLLLTIDTVIDGVVHAPQSGRSADRTHRAVRWISISRRIDNLSSATPSHDEVIGEIHDR